LSSSSLVLHVVRPYASAEEYLAAEAWTIDARAMILIDAEDLALDSAVLFDVALGNGEKVIRAEGKVAGRIAAQGSRPGGLRVKFKRYGAATKAFIDRAVQAQKSAEAAPPAELPPVSVAPVSRNSVTELELQQAEAAAPTVIEVPLVAAPLAPLPLPGSDAKSEPRPPSGVHRRATGGDVEVPPDREALLARLRQRASSVDLDSFSAETAGKTG
jgi:hypothetical protein